MHRSTGSSEVRILQVPSPTPWPMVLALGVALMLTGLVTHAVIGILGLVLVCTASIGWFFQVLPHESHEAIAVRAERVAVFSTRILITRLPYSVSHRKILPIERFRFTTGLRGGVAGGIAMMLPAAAFGLLRYHSVWYAPNLLAAGGFVSWAGASDGFLSEFHTQGLLAGLAIHVMVSLLVGLLYGALLPMFPRYPIITAGFMVPVLFSEILYSVLGIVSPILNERIDWFWFVLSQLAFGLVCGFVVNLHAKIRTPQYQALPFAIRAGIHSDQPAPHGNDVGPREEEKPTK